VLVVATPVAGTRADRDRAAAELRRTHQKQLEKLSAAELARRLLP
jgi:hypothetical protein